MNELQRQAYMEAMGVECLVPRLQLPGALASSLCAMPVIEPVQVDARQNAVAAVVAGSSSATAPAPEHGATPQGSGAAASHALFDVGQNKDQDKAPSRDVKSAVAAVESAASVSKASPAFMLSVVRAGNVLLVDDGLSGSVNPNDYLQLLHNLLFALGAGKQQLSIDAFVWPISNNRQVDQSETAARQMLQAFLAKKIDQSQIPVVIVMGETAAKYVVDQPVEMGVLNEHELWQVQVIRTQSALPLLADPKLKRALWQQLQPLYQWLQASELAKAH